LRSYFPQISKDSQIFKHTDETDTSLNYRINSPKSSYLKLGYSICKKCNNELTQPYDYAWDILLEYLQKNWSIIIKNGSFSLANIFSKDSRKYARHVHLYFVKLFGCKLVDESVSINTARFSEALISETPHRDVFLTFANAPEIPTNDELLGFISRVEFGNYDSCLPDIALWTYMLHPVSIRISYLSRSSPREYRLNAWHPSQPSTQVNLGRFWPTKDNQ